MREIILTDGYRLLIDEECLDDEELSYMLYEMRSDKNSALGITRQIFIKVLGEEQQKALWEHVRNEKGRVPISKLNDILQEVFEILGKKK